MAGARGRQSREDAGHLGAEHVTAVALVEVAVLEVVEHEQAGRTSERSVDEQVARTYGQGSDAAPNILVRAPRRRCPDTDTDARPQGSAGG